MGPGCLNLPGISRSLLIFIPYRYFLQNQLQFSFWSHYPREISNRQGVILPRFNEYEPENTGIWKWMGLGSVLYLYLFWIPS